jgi:hemerythrin
MIEPLRWNESLLIGFAEIDEQHRQLFEQANRFLTSVESGPPWNELENLFWCLEGTSRYHFEEEERLMRWLRYPNLLEHSREHSSFLRQLGEIGCSFEFEAGSTSEFLALSGFLLAGIGEHVPHDGLIGAYANDHALSG